MSTNVSKGQVNKAGDTLRMFPRDPEAIKILESYRLQYYGIVKELFKVLSEDTLHVCSQAVVVWRMKRIESVLSKLHRQEGLQLARMEDLVGCRCIVSSEKEVYKICDLLKEDSRIIVKDRVRDYIREPKPNGYRSLHIACSLPDEPYYYVEVQIRTQQHHSWATLVETTDLLYETHLKESEESENYPCFPKFHRLLSQPECSFRERKELVDIALGYGYLKRIMDVYTENDSKIRKEWKDLAVKGKRFFLLSSSPDGEISIKSFRSIDEAETAYMQVFLLDDKRNSVVVSSRNITFEALNSAYSNYTLNYNRLFYQMYGYISDICIYFYDSRRVFLFNRYYKEFLKMTVMMLKKANLDNVNFRILESQIVEFQRRKNIRKRREWSSSIKDHYDFIRNTFNKTHKKFEGKGLGAIILRMIQLFEYSRFKDIIQSIDKELKR